MSGRIECRASLAPASLSGRSVYATLITSEPLRHCAGEACDAMSSHYVRVVPAGVQHDGSVPLLADHVNATDSLVGLVDEIQLVDDRLVGRLVIDEGELGDKLLAKVKSGSLRAVSIGADILAAEQVGYQGDYPLYEVRASRLRELSLVPVGRDRKALLMSERLENTTKVAKADPAGEVAAIKAAFRAGLNLGMVDECQQLLDAGHAAGSIPEMLIAASVEKARIAAGASSILAQARGTAAGIRAGATDLSHEIGEALEARLSGRGNGGRLGSKRVIDLAEMTLQARDYNTASMTPDGIINAAFSPAFQAAGHTSADFPALMRDAANKSLLRSFEPARSPLTQIYRKNDRRDFRMGYTAQLGEVPRLTEVAEAAEITSGALTEAEESWQVKTYAKIFTLSRVMLVNDDLNAFGDFLRLMGASAAATEGDVLYATLSANSLAGATMADGKALFHTDHANIATANAAISVASLGAAIELMRLQKGLGGEHYIQVEPKYLLVGPKTELLARQAVAAISPVSGRSEFQPWQLEVHVEPRLGTSLSWFVFSDNAVAPVGEYGHLSGQASPSLATDEVFNTLGLSFRAVLDVGAGIISHRGAVKNVGA